MKKSDCSRARHGSGASAALIGILLVGVVIGSPSVARAQDRPSAAGPASTDTETQIRAREMRTNQLLLESVERRRAEINPNSASSAATRHAIAFLDSRIKQLRNLIEKDIEFFRRAS